jgi:hypothetical protein
MSIHTDYIYLDSAERRNLASHLTFNHPREELISHFRNSIRPNVSISRNGDLILNSYVSDTIPGIGEYERPHIQRRETVIYKNIQREKNQCMISYNTIKRKCKYWLCDGCNNAAIYSHINTWFNSHNTCPTCRKEYNFTQDGITYYINANANAKKQHKK